MWPPAAVTLPTACSPGARGCTSWRPPGAWPGAEDDGTLAPPGTAAGTRAPGAGAPGAPTASALLAGSEAMQFFLDRARAVLPGFEITDDNAELIGQLCRRLDGLPLAIELAAAKLRVMAVAQVLTGLDDMLQPAERAALRRLSVFAGSFGLAAAQQVATLGGTDPVDGLDLLARLVDRSLLLVEHTPAQARYRMLATVRQYGAERLAEADEYPAASQAMLSWYLGLAERTGPGLAGPGQARAAGRLEAEAHNLRAVLQAARDRADTTATLRLASALVQFWYLRGHYREGRDWLDWA